MSFYLMHRGWMDNEIFSDEPFTDRLAWAWLIQEASFEPHKIRYKNKMIEVGIGQVPISYRRLVDKWKWGIHRVRNFLGLLESERMISRQTATGFLVISICNYEKYQKPTKISTTQTATATATQATTLTATNINKGKELKEKKEAKSYSPLFEEFWKAFPRKDGSKPLASAAYEKTIQSGISHEILIASVGELDAFHRGKGTEIQHMPHATTWLNQSRWESEYSVKPFAEKPKHKNMMVI